MPKTYQLDSFEVQCKTALGTTLAIYTSQVDDKKYLRLAPPREKIEYDTEGNELRKCIVELHADGEVKAINSTTGVQVAGDYDIYGNPAPGGVIDRDHWQAYLKYKSVILAEAIVE